MDKIILDGMLFFAHHGVTEEEKEAGQPFEVDVDIFADLKRAAADDDLNKTVDYAVVYALVNEVMVGERFSLIETLAEEIAARVLSNQLVEKVIVRVKKLKPPIAGKINSVAVELHRGR
ncbi:MAG: dihydroneopterin aldolase [Actinomycetota bacterium]|nr:dihydroneopterin aldolase [Actinomycetota bacterium]